MTNLRDARIRAAYLGCLIVVPFLRFLVENEYGFLYLEVIAAIAVLGCVCALLAWLARGAVFFVVIALCAAVMSAYPLQNLVGPLQPAPVFAVVLATFAGILVLIRLMREKFFPVMAIFALSGLAVEAVEQYGLDIIAAARRPAGSGNHVLWLILDEQIGIDGFPECPECASAKARLRNTLDKYNFTSFPGAFSNYASTFDSVPSVLNGRLLRGPRELMARQGARHLRNYIVRANSLFDEFAAKGYQVIGYQHASLKTCAPEFGSAECREYRDELGWLQKAPGGWTERFRWIVGSYQASDPVLVRVKGFFPFRFGLQMTGPLAVAGFWPYGLADDILDEPRRTFFFAHVLTPHLPYLYRRDGSVRPLAEWSGDRADERVDKAEYTRRYARYCEQVEFVAGQMDELFGDLERHGVLRNMTVVVHGDHGSRIRRTLVEAPGRARQAGDDYMPDAFDYAGRPKTRDLIDRFSTLLAIKRPGASAPATSEKKHSLLTVLSRVVFQKEPVGGVEATDRVYLVDNRGQLRSIDILRYWRRR